MTESAQASAVMALYAAHVAEIAGRFTEALEAAGFDGVIIYAGEELIVDRDDAAYPFASEPYFKAWVPLTRHPGSAIRYLPGRQPRLVYFQDASFWHEPPAEPAGQWLEQFELVCVGTVDERAAALDANGGRVAAIGPSAMAWPDGIVANDPKLLNALDFGRARKTAYESACIAQANEIAALGHATAQRRYAENATEFEINQAYCEATRQRESELPYGNIVAFNEHAAVLHYQNLRDEAPGMPSSFLLDAGASWNGYAADVTRTVTRGSSDMQALIDAVDSMQQRLCAEMHAGVDFVALNAHAHELVAEVLEERSLIVCSAGDAYERGITRTFLPHGLGHLLGLQVHDAGGRLVDAGGTRREPPREHPMLRLTRVLERDFVVTVEPGIYFIPSLLAALRRGSERDAVNWSVVDALAPFGGVRIEDDVLITDDGVVNLSRPALKATGL